MRGAQDAIEAEGARLVFVGNGSTRQAREFARTHAPGSAIFTDPSAYTYRAIGARSGVATTLGGVAAHGVRAMRAGHFQTSIEGRPFQHGGVLVAMPGDVLAYAYISRMAGDHPSTEAVLGALGDAVRGGRTRPRFTWQPPPPAEDTSASATGPEPVAPDAPAAAPPAAPMPPWPGAPPDMPPPPRPPRWSFEAPRTEPPRSAAG